MAGTILCIEDEAFLREDLADELLLAGYDVLLASNGREGLDLIASRKPDIVITDISMPVMGGYEVLARLRSDQGCRDIPVVFMTAFDEVDTLSACAIRPQACLQKPVDYGDLAAVLEGLLR
jgi:CheY-like chemotaxis protein